MKSTYKVDKLKNYIEQIRGISYKADNILDEYKSGYKVVLRANSIKNNKLELNNLLYVDENLIKEKQFIKANDILIAASSGSKEVVGKSVQILKDTNYTFGAFCKLIRCKNNINPRYVGYFFRTEYYRNTISNVVCGANINNLKNENIDDLNIPIPRLEIQNKIVEILDKSQELIDNRKEQIEKLELLVKSKFIEMFGDPVKNQKKLAKVKLSELGEWKTGGTPLRSKSEYYNGNIPWLSSGELNNKYCFKSNEMITESAIIESAAKIIEVGSLLLGMYDTAALKSTINMIECSCNQAIAYSKLNENLVNTVYVYYCIQIGKEFYKSQQRGVRQKNLNLSMVKGLEILMPPLEFQNQFAEFVKQVDKLKFEMEKSLKELEDNFNSLMQKAFKGKLFK
ncbi:TPA: restriction endonuclease subunit S [Clostridium perfringens]|nr:restriction endonuclease subunit S [Clostridium perfringens]HBI6892442.1 restriction endonuclease subunit S [Clostridium perfringens]HBI6907171.1 restriction endonuclease subunit S [Clostridium perfringens]HBI6925074.1 restriction endonuclease subunit S [Clostridium perfringens]HBI6928456.1 restriction endonuclease subunit S [Clostridium perfringens]